MLFTNAALSSCVIFLVLLHNVVGDVCLLVYQMADNNLEAFLRQDNFELVSSEGILDPTLTTWVYFDGRNYGTDEDIREPLREIYFPDGTPVADKYEGSTYMRWSHDLQKMVIEGFVEGEQDGDLPQTLFDFLSYGLRDCVEKGSTEYMLIMASHGNGMFGFGGDENYSRRRLTLSNGDMAVAMRAALDSVEGAPAKFDVIGFDACSMQSVDVADDLRHATKYVLASEAAEPAEGWTYNYLDRASTASALGIAKNLHDNFISRTPANDEAIPKLISLADMNKFSIFLYTFDSFFEELNKEMLSDQNVHNIIKKAQVESIAFVGGTDQVDTATPSSIDVGSFLDQFRKLCVPVEGSVLDLRLQEASAAYTNQFVSRGLGPGAPSATGMTIMFPRKENVQEGSDLYETLLNTSFSTATKALPKWLAFLENYYSAPSLGERVEGSVCTQKNGSVRSRTYSAKLSLRGGGNGW